MMVTQSFILFLTKVVVLTISLLPTDVLSISNNNNYDIVERIQMTSSSESQVHNFVALSDQNEKTQRYLRQRKQFLEATTLSQDDVTKEEIDGHSITSKSNNSNNSSSATTSKDDIVSFEYTSSALSQLKKMALGKATNETNKQRRNLQYSYNNWANGPESASNTWNKTSLNNSVINTSTITTSNDAFTESRWTSNTDTQTNSGGVLQYVDDTTVEESHEERPNDEDEKERENDSKTYNVTTPFDTFNVIFFLDSSQPIQIDVESLQHVTAYHALHEIQETTNSMEEFRSSVLVAANLSVIPFGLSTEWVSKNNTIVQIYNVTGTILLTSTERKSEDRDALINDMVHSAFETNEGRLRFLASLQLSADSTLRRIYDAYKGSSSEFGITSISPLTYASTISVSTNTTKTEIKPVTEFNTSAVAKEDETNKLVKKGNPFMISLIVAGTVSACGVLTVICMLLVHMRRHYSDRNEKTMNSPKSLSESNSNSNDHNENSTTTLNSARGNSRQVSNVRFHTRRTYDKIKRSAVKNIPRLRVYSVDSNSCSSPENSANIPKPLECSKKQYDKTTGATLAHEKSPIRQRTRDDTPSEKSSRSQDILNQRIQFISGGSTFPLMIERSDSSGSTEINNTIKTIQLKQNEESEKSEISSVYSYLDSSTLVDLIEDEAYEDGNDDGYDIDDDTRLGTWSVHADEQVIGRTSNNFKNNILFIPSPAHFQLDRLHASNISLDDIPLASDSADTLTTMSGCIKDKDTKVKKENAALKSRLSVGPANEDEFSVSSGLAKPSIHDDSFSSDTSNSFSSDTTKHNEAEETIRSCDKKVASVAMQKNSETPEINQSPSLPIGDHDTASSTSVSTKEEQPYANISSFLSSSTEDSNDENEDEQEVIRATVAERKIASAALTYRHKFKEHQQRKLLIIPRQSTTITTSFEPPQLSDRQSQYQQYNADTGSETDDIQSVDGDQSLFTTYSRASANGVPLSSDDKLLIEQESSNFASMNRRSNNSYKYQDHYDADDGDDEGTGSMVLPAAYNVRGKNSLSMYIDTSRNIKYKSDSDDELSSTAGSVKGDVDNYIKNNHGFSDLASF